MTSIAQAEFTISSWDEDPYDELPGSPRLSQASVAKAFEGDLEGQSRLEYLMLYRPDGSASFMGYERFTGRLGEKTGSFVLEHRGAFEGGTARALLTVVEGSATGELAGLRGEGEFTAGHAARYALELTYALD